MTDCQKCLLLLLANGRSLTCNEAGAWLVEQGLAKQTGDHCSNNVLTGSAVMRSLKRLGFAGSYKSADSCQVIYFATHAGMAKAVELGVSKRLQKTK